MIKEAIVAFIIASIIAIPLIMNVHESSKKLTVMYREFCEGRGYNYSYSLPMGSSGSGYYNNCYRIVNATLEVRPIQSFEGVVYWR